MNILLRVDQFHLSIQLGYYLCSKLHWYPWNFKLSIFDCTKKLVEFYGITWNCCCHQNCEIPSNSMEFNAVPSFLFSMTPMVFQLLPMINSINFLWDAYCIEKPVCYLFTANAHLSNAATGSGRWSVCNWNVLLDIHAMLLSVLISNQSFLTHVVITNQDRIYTAKENRPYGGSLERVDIDNG